MLTKVQGEYGLGFGIGEKEGALSFSHGGANEGFRCTLFAYREGGRGAIVMTNGDRGDLLGAEILRSIAAEYAWPDYKPEQKSVAEVAPAVLRSYAGKYQFTPGPLLTITLEEGRLFAQMPDGTKSEILPESTASFFNLDGRSFRFTRKDDGSIELEASGSRAKRM